MSDVISSLAGGANTWYGRVNEDGSFSVLARMTSLDGSGTQVAPQEGNCLTQADVLTITCKVFDLGTSISNPAGTEVPPAPTVVVATSIFDTLRMTGWPVASDAAGYNFRFDVAETYVTKADNWYLLEFRFALSGGGISWLRVKVKTLAVQTS